MTNMRRGFTMIELVFVIVIIGILAAVALPRFTGISDDAHVSKLQAFVGTLNRTTGPSVWSGLQRGEPVANGQVTLATIPKYATLGTEASALGTDAQLDTIPSELIGAGAGQLADETAVLVLANCAPAGTTIPAIGQTGGAGIGGDLVQSATIGNSTYVIGCVDSDLANAPKFYMYDANPNSATLDQIITK